MSWHARLSLGVLRDQSQLHKILAHYCHSWKLLWTSKRLVCLHKFIMEEVMQICMQFSPYTRSFHFWLNSMILQVQVLIHASRRERLVRGKGWRKLGLKSCFWLHWDSLLSLVYSSMLGHTNCYHQTLPVAVTVSWSLSTNMNLFYLDSECSWTHWYILKEYNQSSVQRFYCRYQVTRTIVWFVTILFAVRLP